MGPTTLFDKSFLQSLSVDEAVLFDHFTIPAICPLFYVETLADLEKAVRQGRTPEQEVGIIASKAPEMSSAPVVHRIQLAIQNLLGGRVPMTGQIPMAGGKVIKVEGKTGVIHRNMPEAEAFTRWQAGDFLQVERQFAKAWRDSLNSLDLMTVASAMRAMGIDSQTCKSLGEAKSIATALVNRAEGVPDQIKFALILFGASSPPLEQQIMERWRRSGCPSLVAFAPYAAYVMATELFFQIALGSHLISAERCSNRIDVAYLAYLPFCMVFVSSDKLHRRCAEHFLRPNQSFVWGLDLKADFQRLCKYYAGFPDAEKEKGLDGFARYPPREGDYLVAKMWDSHLPAWREERQPNVIPHQTPRANQDAELIKQIKNFEEARPLAASEIDFDPADVDMFGLHRRINKQKGSWFQLPKDLKRH